jgi:hypothetical protein
MRHEDAATQAENNAVQTSVGTFGSASINTPTVKRIIPLMRKKEDWIEATCARCPAATAKDDRFDTHSKLVPQIIVLAVPQITMQSSVQKIDHSDVCSMTFVRSPFLPASTGGDAGIIGKKAAIVVTTMRAPTP